MRLIERFGVCSLQMRNSPVQPLVGRRAEVRLDVCSVVSLASEAT